MPPPSSLFPHVSVDAAFRPLGTIPGEDGNEGYAGRKEEGAAGACGFVRLPWRHLPTVNGLASGEDAPDLFTIQLSILILQRSYLRDFSAQLRFGDALTYAFRGCDRCAAAGRPTTSNRRLPHVLYSIAWPVANASRRVKVLSRSCPPPFLRGI